jgi:co-chaperonin GroES (HSP10)
MVEFYQPKSTSKIVIPDAAQKHDSHRMGIVRFIGDGKLRGSTEVREPLVSVGDKVMFQINNIMEATQTFIHDGKTCMNLLQEELIARTHGDDLGVESMEMLGDYALLEHFRRQQPGSSLFLPETLSKESAPDFIYFKLVKKGSRVNLPIEPGDELVVNFGRLTPMFVVRRGADGVTHNEEYCYTRTSWIDGVVERTP